MPQPIPYDLTLPSAIVGAGINGQSSEGYRPPTGTTQPYLGFGLIRPFVRDERGDFAADGNVALVKACVGQVLGTILGELPWRPEFGCRLFMLRHRGLSEVTRALARAYVTEALTRWEPRVRVVDVAVAAATDINDTTLQVSVTFDILQASSPQNQVVTREQTAVSI